MAKVLILVTSRRVTDDEADQMRTDLRVAIPESTKIVLLEGIHSVQLVDIPDAITLPAILPVDPE